MARARTVHVGTEPVLARDSTGSWLERIGRVWRIAILGALRGKGQTVEKPDKNKGEQVQGEDETKRCTQRVIIGDRSVKTRMPELLSRGTHQEVRMLLAEVLWNRTTRCRTSGNP